MYFINYCLFLIFSRLLRLLPRRWICALSVIGAPILRKRTLNNLAQARALPWDPSIASAASRNLALVFFEYLTLTKKTVEEICTHENEHCLIDACKNGGAIVVSGHQANWELTFLDISRLVPAVVVGRPIRNRFIYNAVISLRNLFGGVTIPPKNATSAMLTALKESKTVCVAADQGYPESSFSCDFLGSIAWSTTLPAVLAARSQRPIVFVFSKRNGPFIHMSYGPCLYPDPSLSFKEDVLRMSYAVQHELENHVKKAPGEWLWAHKRWKRQGVNTILRQYRHDHILVIANKDQAWVFDTLRMLYPRATLYTPESVENDHIIQMIVSFSSLPRRFACVFAHIKLLPTSTEEDLIRICVRPQR